MGFPSPATVEDAQTGSPKAGNDWTVRVVVNAGTPQEQFEVRSLTDMGILQPAWKKDPPTTRTRILPLKS